MFLLSKSQWPELWPPSNMKLRPQTQCFWETLTWRISSSGMSTFLLMIFLLSIAQPIQSWKIQCQCQNYSSQGLIKIVNNVVRVPAHPESQHIAVGKQKGMRDTFAALDQSGCFLLFFWLSLINDLQLLQTHAIRSRGLWSRLLPQSHLRTRNPR